MALFKSYSPRLVKILILLVWAVLFGALLHREYSVRTVDVREELVLRKAEEESFYGVYFRGDRIGYVKNSLTPSGQGLTLREHAFLNLNVLGERHPVRMDVSALLGDDFLLRSFDFSLASPFYAMSARGNVEGNLVRFTLSTGKEQVADSIRLNGPPYISTQRRAYLLSQELKEGERISVPFFDPVSLSGKATVFEYRGVRKELVKGRIRTLHHFIETYSGIRINSWLDDSGMVVKEESPAGFVFIAEPEFKATNIAGSSDDIVSAVAVAIKGNMPDLAEAASLRLRLDFPEESELDLGGGRQRFEAGVLEIRQEILPPDDSPICEGQAESLAASAYVQSASPRIKEKSLEIAGQELPPMQKVRRLADWVHGNIRKRPVVGVPDAISTLKSGIGDCNEHAALFAALARSAGIPTRIAAGVAFMENAFFYHAWNEVCVNNTWISVDTTFGQLPADVGHLRFLHGELQEQVHIVPLLGRLRIEVLD